MGFRVFVLWLHLLAVVVWVGGAFFWGLVLLTGREKTRTEAPWIERLGRRFYTVGWEALGVLVLTGLFNLIGRVQTGVFFQSAYLTPLLIKLALVAGMAGVQGWQHFGLLPRVTSAATGDTSLPRWRRRMLIASGLFLGLAAGVIWMGVRLRYL